ncbi:phasin family protein [Salibaculum sp.]|uniref:phasin family protein n=1 Tax=Salibaculum sp. TaxID=2855480 RepID=UPI002B4644DF|nr:phasin family protein [Salibaculum sp.]HKL68827.1 phasin family protein [Salibaculum sp.]
MTKSKAKPDQDKPEAPAFSSALATGHPAATLWLEVMAESTRFLSERVRTDLEMQQAMLRCQSPTEMVRLQSEFFRKAIDQYTSEAQRMFEIMSDVTDQTLKQTRTGTKRGYDDVPL